MWSESRPQEKRAGAVRIFLFSERPFQHLLRDTEMSQRKKEEMVSCDDFIVEKKREGRNGQEVV